MSRAGIAVRASFVVTTFALSSGLTPFSAPAHAAGKAAGPDPAVCVYQYAVPDGEAYFAIAMRGDAARLPQREIREHVVLVGTSASQAGAYRKRQMEVVSGYLAALGESDRVRLFAIELVGFCLQHDVAERGAPVEQHRILKHNADVGARSIDEAAASPHAATRWRKQAGGDHQQRALAAAARADVGQKFAAALCERNIVERAHLAIARRVNLGQMLEAQIRLIVVGDFVHALAAAQASCGGTYSAPVGTNSLV